MQNTVPFLTGVVDVRPAIEFSSCMGRTGAARSMTMPSYHRTQFPNHDAAARCETIGRYMFWAPNGPCVVAALGSKDCPQARAGQNGQRVNRCADEHLDSIIHIEPARLLGMRWCGLCNREHGTSVLQAR
jgi:hypothetical protein